MTSCFVQLAAQKIARARLQREADALVSIFLYSYGQFDSDGMCFVYRCGRNAEWLRNREGWTAWRGGKRRTSRGSTRNAKRRANEPRCDSTRFGKFILTLVRAT